MKPIKKVLIIRLSAIGDIAWTSPVVRCIKKQLPGIELHYCTKRQFASLVGANPYIDKLHFYEGNLSLLISALKKERFDYVIDLHKNIRSLFIKLLLGRPSSTYNKLWAERFLYTRFQINLMPNCHVVDRYFEAVAPLGVANDDQGLDYFIADKDEVELEWLPQPFCNGYVAYVIGGTKFTKILPFKKMVELCDKINRPIVVIGGKEDAATGGKLERFFARAENNMGYEEGLRQLDKKVTVFNACGKFNLSQSASLVRQANYVFGHDTGLTHIAAAFKKTIFSIWGGTVPNNFYSYGTKFYILENSQLKCRPCSKSGRSKCPKGHFKCMNDIVFDFSLP